MKEQNNEYKLLQGNEACVEAAIIAGMRFFAGYPITPSTEIAEFSAEKLPMVGGKFIQMEDEIASMAAVIGASLAGLKAMTATSGPGFSLKQENIGYASLTEVPCVIVNVQRGGPSTGLPTQPAQGDMMQARWGTHGDHPIIALYPSSVEEIFYTTIRAFNLSEKYRVPVVLLLDEVIAHMRERVKLPDTTKLEIVNRKKPEVTPDKYIPYRGEENLVPPMASFGEGYKFHVTGLIHDEFGFPTNKPEEIEKLIKRLIDKIYKNIEDIITYENHLCDDAEIIVVAYGCVGRSAKKAVTIAREKGLKVGLFRPITIWPFPEEPLKKVASGKTIIVAEMNMGQLVLEIERITGCTAKIHRFNKINGELITPDEIIAKIEEVY